MLAHQLVDRPTQDVDMFTPEDDVTALADALVAVLRREGLVVVVEAQREGADDDAVVAAVQIALWTAGSSDWRTS